ncbi:MAG: twin-arginine translocase TatA/TatE family subunit [Haloarculaceae archaeon]
MVPASLSGRLVPAFPGLPGGPELLIVFLIMVLVFGLPLVLLAGAVFLGWNVLGSGRGRVEELEDRVAEVERELERERGSTGSGTRTDEREREERD